MKCPRCHARNSPAAFECHNCEAPLRDEESEARGAPASTWGARAVPVVAALLLLGAVGGGNWLGDWYVRQSPVVAVPTATPGPTSTPRPTLMPQPTTTLISTPKPTITPAAPSSVLDERTSLGKRYEAWKQAHAEPVEDLMALYSPQAYITFTVGPDGGVKELRDIAVQVRQSRSFASVQDVGQARVAAVGERAVVMARHRYGHSSRPKMPSYGDRTLVWERKDGEWLVVEDHFPTSFSSTP